MPGTDDSSRPLVTPPIADTNTGIGGKSALAPPLVGTARYELGEEVARGGMGVVYRATDTALGREVAVKVLQDRFGPESPAARRFADEARITAQLQHPGIPPVYDQATLPDGCPFLAMKLIKGSTLDHLLATRPDPSHDCGRFVAIFEKVCEAVAYAHARGILHRDLKPGNVMVGSYGEVQVMDWGLAKVLAPSRSERDADPERTTAETEVRSLRDGEGAFTQAGSVLGTPAYMPPEQAIGAIDQIDTRSDVFGLGGILVAVLTGRPPFQADTAESTRQIAAKGKVEGCFARLDGCGADPELVALCKRCLAPEKDDRPADAGEAARAVAALRAAADERARRAELGRAEAAVREAEGRRRRRVWLGLAAALAAGLVASLGLASWANAARKAAEAAKEEAEEAREQEAKQRREAERQTRLANAVKNFLKQDVLHLSDQGAQHRDTGPAYTAEVRLRDVLVRAANEIEGKFADQPLVEAELLSTISFTLQGMGRADLAAPHFERARAIYTERLGPDHGSTTLSMHNLANNYDALGRRADALRLREELLSLRRVKWGPDSPAALGSMLSLANSYDALGSHADALKLREQALALQKARLGADHPDTLMSMHNLAASYAALGRHAEACKLREQALALRHVKLDPDHPDTLNSELGAIASLVALKRTGEALSLIEKVLALANQAAASGKRLHPALKLGLIVHRLRILRDRKDAQGFRQTVEMYEKLGRTDSGSLYYTARCRAVLAGLLAGDPATAKPEADRAMAWLTRAVAAGVRDRARIQKNADLAPLHNRDDFKTLMNGLPELLPMPRKD